MKTRSKTGGTDFTKWALICLFLLAANPLWACICGTSDATGLRQGKARYLSNDLTRFTSVDPAGIFNPKNPQTWNKYSYSLNDPINLLDPDGRWPTEWPLTVHQNSVDRVLGGLPKSDRAILKSEQVVSDVDQSTAGAYKHAMRGTGQSVEEAKQQANDYVKGMIGLAQTMEAEGSHDLAMQFLGDAMHTLQDATSPSHEGFQEWNEDWTNSTQGIKHVMKEGYDPGEGSKLDQATKNAHDYFTGKKEMPKDLFSQDKKQ